MKVMLISLGCDKNRVDSEYMLGALAAEGHVITDDENEAEAVIVNSCCFIGDAKEESINTILEYAALKTEGKLKKLIVTGCLAQRYPDDIRREIPEVDDILGTTAYDKIAEALKDDGETYLDDLNRLPECGKRLMTGESYVSYLKIAEGCKRHCTYCIIPKVRGDYRSVPMEKLVEEATNLAEGGARELVLVAQETTLYGIDLYGKKSLHILLEKLNAIEELGWIRVMYCYPEEIYDELLDAMAKLDKVVPYLDLPVQHASDKILAAMGRKTNKAQLLEIIRHIRKKLPGVTLRTTMITGFPGETEDDVDVLENFVKQARFDRLGVFTYSREEGTPAAKMPGQVNERVKKSRRARIMETASVIQFEKAAETVGRELDVMIEGYMPEEGVYVGRTYRDAPDIDGVIFLETDEKYMSGDIVKALVTEAKDYDLIGVVKKRGGSKK